MNIKLKHNPKKCWACKYQQRINKLCEKYDFGIEYNFFKDRGDFVPTISYTGIYRHYRIPLVRPLEVRNYNRNEDILADIFRPLSNKSIKILIKDLKRHIKNLLK